MKDFSSSHVLQRDLKLSCLSPSPSPSLSFPSMHRPTLSFAWLSCLWRQKHNDGNSTRRQLQSGLLRVRRKDQNYTFRKERERIQNIKENYTNCLEESKIDIRTSPSLGLREGQRGGLASLGLEEKLSRKLPGVPHRGWPQAGVHWQIPL